MKIVSRRFQLLSTCFLGAVFCCASVTKAEDDGIGKLDFVGSTKRDKLQMVTSVEVSADGKFLYASAWRPATITVFERDAVSGQLKQVQELTDPEHLQGTTALRISPDGQYAVASAFSARTAVLFRRDAKSGKLKKLNVAQDSVDGVTGLTWPIDVAFSPDSKFAYIVDSRGPSDTDISAGSVTVFRIADDELEFVEAGQDSGFANVRGIAVSPDGNDIAVTSSDAATLIVLNRIESSGKTSTRQVIEDERNGVHGLDGAMGVAMSADGQFVYVSSGRFRGDNAIGVYRFDDEGELSLVQELENGTDDLQGFEGGNEITVSPDGLNVYAVGSGSSSLACFEREPETGRLRLLETIPDEQDRLKAAAGICVSPDGEFVYVAAEQSGSISVFRRQTK